MMFIIRVRTEDSEGAYNYWDDTYSREGAEILIAIHLRRAQREGTGQYAKARWTIHEGIGMQSAAIGSCEDVTDKVFAIAFPEMAEFLNIGQPSRLPTNGNFTMPMTTFLDGVPQTISYSPFAYTDHAPFVPTRAFPTANRGY